MRRKSINEQRRKRGSASTHGFVNFGGQIIHVATEYGASDREVFVVHEHDGETDWLRIPLKQAKSEKRQIIRCSYGRSGKRPCHRPAKRLDHSWPYLSGDTKCDKHLNTEYED